MVGDDVRAGQPMLVTPDARQMPIVCLQPAASLSADAEGDSGEQFESP
jgi:hypothetical protein